MHSHYRIVHAWADPEGGGGGGGWGGQKVWTRLEKSEKYRVS